MVRPPQPPGFVGEVIEGDTDLDRELANVGIIVEVDTSLEASAISIKLAK